MKYAKKVKLAQRHAEHRGFANMEHPTYGMNRRLRRTLAREIAHTTVVNSVGMRMPRKPKTARAAR